MNFAWIWLNVIYIEINVITTRKTVIGDQRISDQTYLVADITFGDQILVADIIMSIKERKDIFGIGDQI